MFTLSNLIMVAIFMILIMVFLLYLAYKAGGRDAEFKQMQERIGKLETQQSKRLPYGSQDAIEDATANVLWEFQDIDVRRARMETLLRHLQTARNPGSNNNGSKKHAESKG